MHFHTFCVCVHAHFHFKDHPLSIWQKTVHWTIAISLSTHPHHIQDGNVHRSVTDIVKQRKQPVSMN